MTRKKKGANLEYYWCPTLKTTSWDKKMPCDVDVHKITDNKSGGGKKEEEELRKKLLIVTKPHGDDPIDGERFQKKMNLAAQGKFDTKSKSLYEKLVDNFKSSKKEPTIDETLSKYNEQFKDLDDVYVVRPRFGIGGKRKKSRRNRKTKRRKRKKKTRRKRKKKRRKKKTRR